MNEADTSYFLPYQEAWINDNSPLKVAEKSRRVGFTYASSYQIGRDTSELQSRI